MPKITFLGAGSTIFAKNVLGDCLLTPALHDAHIALYDIDAGRLEDSRRMLENLNANLNAGRAVITAHCGVRRRRAALRGADFVVNAVQVGGYEPSTVIDFEIPKKYGLRQTIADTIGVGGIFRALRTIPVLDGFACDMEAVCPGAWFLNYVNPMSILTGHMLRRTGVRTVGLCHSVQECASRLLKEVGMEDRYPGCRWRIAGINHMAWLLEIEKDGRDLYPEIRRRALRMNDDAIAGRAPKHGDMVRFEILRHFGYYNTESSEHTAEYHPYFIKRTHPELVGTLNIPLDEYPRRCVAQIAGWEKRRQELLGEKALRHERSTEYASHIMEAALTGVPCEIGGNVLNRGGLIPNLPPDACVEVPCMVTRNGVQGCRVGPLPEQLAALNLTHIGVHELVLEAAATLRRDKVYQAAMLDPHTRAELTLDEIRRLCDDLFAAHGAMLPKFR
jgi:alpha-galactosidase